jgi:opacity protein-like surface antigen
MKKLFTILTVIALTTTVSYAQFSAKAGLNMANIVSNDNDSENGMKLGMIIGGNYAMELSDAMSLDVSLTFKQSGTKESDEETSGGVTMKSTQTIALNYLDVSPSLSFNVSDAMSLSVGPYVAFALSGNLKWEYSAEGNGVDESESDSEAIDFGDGDDDDGIKAMDFGLNIGASYSINDAMSVSAGYALGLTNLMYIDDDMKDAYDAMDEDLPSIKNSGIFLTFGYTFGG